MTESEIKQLFKGVFDSVVSAQREIEKLHLTNLFKTYFHAGGKAKNVRIEHHGKNITAPLITLVPNQHIAISEVTLDMTLNIEMEEKKGLRKLLFHHGKKQNAQLHIKFTGTDQPEGIARINEKLSQTIS